MSNRCHPRAAVPVTQVKPEDLKDESFRRLFTNAIFWTAKRDPEKMTK